MSALKLLVLLVLACVHIQAIPKSGNTRNTIFGDERVEGAIFKDVDIFDSFDYKTRSNSAYRLPTTTRPQHYTILLAVNITELTYSGTVDIELYATQVNVGEIVLHSDHHVVTSVVLTQGSTTIPTTYTLQSIGQLLRVQLTDGWLAYSGTSSTVYNLSINFNAPLRADTQGLYKSWFRNAFNEQERWMASTQFSPTSARYAFPCYDEPSFKATYDVTIRRPITHSSWFGTRLRETRNSTFSGYQEDSFYRSPIMSTYVFGIVVAEFDSIELFSNNLLMHEVIARPGAISAGQGQYALDTAQALLAEMNIETDYNYFSQNSDLKMTQAAIPNFHFGAMENWGLLTYREANLMYDAQDTNGHNKQTCANILAHEIAHMWYGNLVSFQWWETVWLKEGFARFYQYFLADRVEGMGLATRFITDQVHFALLADSANNPHPLTNPGVATNAEVLAMFSTLSYNKGAVILRQTEHLLGSEVLRDGLRFYLKQYAFGVVNPDKYFNALEQVANDTGSLQAYGPEFSFPAYYKSWTEQAGHPVLNVQVNHETGDMTIYQRRFNINTGYSATGNNYIIPITFATASSPDFNNTKPTHIISDAISVLNRGSIGDEWVIFNKQQTGFYRVNYDDYTWDLITMALRSNDRTRIHEYNRAQIVDDVFSFARSGLMSYNRALNILSFLQYETDFAPWDAAIEGFTWIRNRLIGTAELDRLENLIATWSSTIMSNLTYYPTAAEEPFMRSYFRYTMAPTMCLIGIEDCLNAARAQFLSFSASGIEVTVDNRPWVYCNGLRYGTLEDFNFIWTRYLQHNVYSEKIVILSALGCTSNADALNLLLTNIVQDNYIIRAHYYTTAFRAAVNGNEANTQIVFTFIQNNLQDVINAFGNAVTPFSFISARLRTEQEINAFQDWATTNRIALGDDFNAVYNGAEFTRESIQWAAEVRDDLNDYFNHGDQNLQTSTTVPDSSTLAITSEQPNLIEPTTPDIPLSPDLAITNVLSVVVIGFAIVAYFV